MRASDEPSSSNPPARPHAVGLDILRGLAALAVVLLHTRTAAFVDFGALPDTDRGPATLALFAVSRLGREAVLVFFALSGFLVGGGLLRRLASRQFDPEAYALARLSRIGLPLLPACLFTGGLALAGGAEPPSLVALSAHLVGLNGVLVPTSPWNGPLWSLAYEIWFYVGAGALATVWARRARSGGAWLGLAATVAVFSVLAPHYALIWLLGAAAALPRFERRARLGLVGGGALGVLGTLAYELAQPSKTYAFTAPIPLEVAECLVGAGCAAALPWLAGAEAERWLGRLRRPAARLAAVSFSLYLFHYPVNRSLAGLLPERAAVTTESVGWFVVRLGICLAAGVAAYALFEQHHPRLRAWLERRRGVQRGGERAR